MKNLIAIFLLFLVGCAKHENQFYIQPDLEKYFDQFITSGIKYNKTFSRENAIIIVQAGAVEKYGGLGVSRTDTDGQRYIYLDREFWETASESKRETVFMHECGHTFLGRQHNAGWSIMNPIYGRAGWPICVGNEQCPELLIKELYTNKL